ncbi:MAG TPA: sigma-70 family RNA polymerase sigma factor [Bacteroidia bacterium]|nr:sigma-70 family RNA polymerase sigma factor [Bacteroidia bacterium]
MVELNNEIKKLSDEALVARFREKGDSICVGELFSRYRHLVFGVCMKYLSDEDESQDVQMQVFEKLLRDLGLHQVEQFKGWLYAVTKNECLMYIRSRKSRRAKEDELKKDMKGLMENENFLHPDGVTETEIQLREMESGLGQLGDNQRRCLELFYLEKKCYREVSEITGYSMNEVKSNIQNGKRNLKLLLANRKHG